MNLLQRLTVLMYEPDTGSFRELVFMDSIRLKIEVVQAVAGEKFVALVIRLPKGQGYEIRVFDIARVRQSAPLFTKIYPKSVSVAWRGPNEILVMEPRKAPQSVPLQTGQMP